MSNKEGKSTFINDMKKAIEAVEDTFAGKQQTTMMNYFPVKHGKSNPRGWNREMEAYGWWRVEKQLAKRKTRNKSWKRSTEEKKRQTYSNWSKTVEKNNGYGGWGKVDPSYAERRKMKIEMEIKEIKEIEKKKKEGGGAT